MILASSAVLTLPILPVASSSKPLVADIKDGSTMHMGVGCVIDFTNTAMVSYCTGVSAFTGFVGLDRASRLRCCAEQMDWGIREWRRIFYLPYNEDARESFEKFGKSEGWGERYLEAMMAIRNCDPDNCHNEIKSISKLRSDAARSLIGHSKCVTDVIGCVESMYELDLMSKLFRLRQAISGVRECHTAMS